MTDEYKIIYENIEAVKGRIEYIKRKKNIDYDIILLAATKMIPPEKINFIIGECGVTDIGENRVQELLDKYDKINKTNVNIHFIGKLQTNKVKYIIDKVSLIHSLDSYKLAAEINRQSEKYGRITDVLIEINIGGEISKSGIAPEELSAFIDEISDFSRLRVRGLMVIPPICSDTAEYIKFFQKTYSIFIDILQKKIHNIYSPILSMGMSDNYETALEHGSNLIRLGTAIFGLRSN